LDTSQLNLGILLDVYFHCISYIKDSEEIKNMRWTLENHKPGKLEL